MRYFKEKKENGMTFHKMKIKLAAFGLALAMGLIPTGNLPTAYAAEGTSGHQENVTQENAGQGDTQETARTQRRVVAKDLTKKVNDKSFSIGTSLEGIEFDPEKDEVSFYKVVGDDGSEYLSYRAGSYTASYLVTPKDQGECYVVTRKIILTDTEGSAHVSGNGGERQKTDTDPEDGADAKDSPATKTDVGSNKNAEQNKDSEPKKDAGPDNDSESKDDTELNAGSDSKKDAEPDNDSEPKNDAESDTDSESKKDSGQNTDSESKKEPNQKPDTKDDSESGDKPETKPQDTAKGKITISGGKGDTEESLSRLLEDIAEGKLLLVSAAGNTSGALDSAVNVEKGEDIQCPDSLGDYGTSLFQINGGAAYCLEAQKPKTFTVDAVSSELESNGNLQKVLYYGYGGKGDLTGECLSGEGKEEKYVYTQIAASYAYAGETGFLGCTPEELKNTDVGAYIEFLFGQDAPPSNTLSLSVVNQSNDQNKDVSVDAAQDGNLQKTPEIRLDGDSRNYIEISIPEEVACHNVAKDTTVTNGTIKIYGGDSFCLSTNMHVTGQYASGEMSGSLKEDWKVLILSSSEGKADTDVFESPSAEPVSFTVNWHGQAKISLLKKDRDTDEPLSGAAYGIYKDYKCKELLAEMPETGEDGKTASGYLDTGLKQVYVKETKAPEGYLLDSNVYPVDVENGKETEMTVYDVREKDGQEQPTETHVTKTDAVTGELLEGAVLQVSDQEGNLVEEWTSTKEAHVIHGLAEGEYILHEKMAPYKDGYVSASDITFQVSAESMAEVEMKDGYSKIDLSVQDQTTGKELSGAAFQIVGQDGKVLKEWVTDGKPYRVEKLPVNEELTLRETAAPEGYTIPKEIKFTVTDTEEVQPIEMKNARVSQKESKPGNASGSGKTSAPRTGDSLVLPAALFVVSLLSFIVLAVLLIRRRRR